MTDEKGGNTTQGKVMGTRLDVDFICNIFIVKWNGADNMTQT